MEGSRELWEIFLGGCKHAVQLLITSMGGWRAANDVTVVKTSAPSMPLVTDQEKPGVISKVLSLQSVSVMYLYDRRDKWGKTTLSPVFFH